MARRFNPPPNWPPPPEGFTPDPDWRPDPSWSPPPKGWQLWIDDKGEAAKRPNWFVRHKIITATIAIVLLVVVIRSGGDNAPKATQSDNGATPAPTTAPSSPDDASRPTPTQSPTAPTKPASIVMVASAVDGDTLRLADGRTVRLIGVDAPERGACGFGPAKSLTKRLTVGKRVTLGTGALNDKDRYGRLLRYVQVGSSDVGLELLKAGLATARYDSRDGYGAHPRQSNYVRVDDATPQRACPSPTPSATPKPTPKPERTTDPIFGTCREAKAAGVVPPGGYREGVDPEYGYYRDADSDGRVCE